MAQERVERRLAAILAADVVGYSRLVGLDEEGTIARLKAVREELIDPNIARHGGRIVKTMGDGLLVEFPSVVDAVRSAVEVQQAMAERNADVPEDQCIVFRVGVNSGDIVVQGDDILGDGVNIAARLEGLAEPGGVCISGAAFDQVESRLDVEFEDLGAKQVKNIAKPVHVYRLRLAANASAASGGAANDLAASGGAANESAAPELPDKPSIAVLPFENMSGDPEQTYFCDGMVEEIITALARFQWLHVIARNSSFTYKGRAIDIRQVARELGVRYVLEGSVRKAANRVRITGQLIEAATGAHIWADRFDGDYGDVFDLQDRITSQVVGAIEPRIRAAEIERARRRRPDSLEAYDLYLRALPHACAATPEDNKEAVELLERAVALDPGFAPAAAQAAWCYQQRATFSWEISTGSDAERAVEHARAAIAADKNDANSLATAGFVLAIVGHDMERSRMAVERALELNPNDPVVQGFTGQVRTFLGEQDSALNCFETALRLNPGDPMAFAFLHGSATAHLLAGRFEEAVAFATRAAHENANFNPIFRVLAASYAQLGKMEEAQKAVGRLLELDPGTSIAVQRARLPFQDRTQFERLLDGLRMAGLPE